MKTKFKTQKIRTLESKPRIRIHANILDKPDKFKTQKIKFKPIFKPPHHQNIKHKNQIQIFSPQTQNSKPKFSYTLWETKHNPQIQTLELKPNHLQPQIQNYQTQTKSTSPDNKNISSLSRRCFLLARVCLGCGFAWRWFHGGDRGSWVLGLWSWK